MTTTRQTSLRLPLDLLERVDAYALRIGAQVHLDITRTDAVTMLSQSALKAEPAPKQPMLPHDPARAKPRKAKPNVKR